MYIVKNLGTVERTLLASVSQGRFDYVVGKIKIWEKQGKTQEKEYFFKEESELYR